MPFHEYREQAELYLEIGKQCLLERRISEAKNSFQMARAIASHRGLIDLIFVIDGYLNNL